MNRSTCPPRRSPLGATSRLRPSITPPLLCWWRYDHGTATVASTILARHPTLGRCLAGRGLRVCVPSVRRRRSNGGPERRLGRCNYPRRVDPDSGYRQARVRGLCRERSISFVSIIDVAAQAVTRTIPQQGEGIAFTPDGEEVYIAGGIGGPNQINVYRPSDLALLAQVPASTCRPINVTMFPSGAFAAVTDDACGQVFIISTATRTVSRVIAAQNAWSTVVTPDESRIYVTEPNFNRVQVFSTWPQADSSPPFRLAADLMETRDDAGRRQYLRDQPVLQHYRRHRCCEFVINTLSGFSRPVGVVILPAPRGATPAGSNVTVSPWNREAMRVRLLSPLPLSLGRVLRR